MTPVLCACGQPVGGACSKLCLPCAKRRRTEARRKKYVFTPQVDQLIAEAYRKFRVYGSRTAIANLAKRLEWPKWVVNRRARDLRLSRVKELPWSDREVRLLEQHAWMCPDKISEKLRAAGFE